MTVPMKYIFQFASTPLEHVAPYCLHIGRSFLRGFTKNNRNTNAVSTLILVLTLSSSALASDKAPALNTLTPQQIDDGWILLFDGKTLFGWESSIKADWHVADGAIHVTSGEVGLLHTTTQFGDYQLHLEFHRGEKTNSGVFLHTPSAPQNPQQDCYEVNIAPPENVFPTGSLVGRRKATGAKTASGWQSLDATVQAGQITVKLNGVACCQYDDPHPLSRGFIGLQHNQGTAAFRNIKLKPLGLKSIFNGKDLSGWKTDQQRKSEFSVTEAGEIKMINGSGQLESKGTYGDFVLQLEAKCNGKELNSGIFFRSIPGDYMMGYESQIHNGMKDNDPRKPSVSGTGGIFRRQNARRIVARDFEWFAKTIVADGPHMAVWVNGYPVSDWTDTREVHENPRKGKRTKAGTFILQGHDPTTDILFRNLRAVEIAKRK